MSFMPMCFRSTFNELHAHVFPVQLQWVPCPRVSGPHSMSFMPTCFWSTFNEFHAHGFPVHVVRNPSVSGDWFSFWSVTLSSIHYTVVLPLPVQYSMYLFILSSPSSCFLFYCLSFISLSSYMFHYMSLLLSVPSSCVLFQVSPVICSLLMYSIPCLSSNLSLVMYSISMSLL